MADARERDWSSLPTGILEEVLSRLRWSSHPAFALVCRHWRSAVSPFYPTWITPLLLSSAAFGSTAIRYYSPYYRTTFELAAPATLTKAPGAKILCAAAGRRVALCLRKAVLDADLLTGEVRELPPIPERTRLDQAVYGDGGRRLLAVRTIGLIQAAVATTDGGGWDLSDLIDLADGTPHFHASAVCNPVLLGGLLYALGEDGRLAAYDERRHEQGFRLLDRPTGFGGLECHVCYLAQSDRGELMAVLVGRRGAPLHVLRLDEEATMEWEKVESLEGRALFTGALTSVVTKKTGVKWMRDKVFLPRFYDWPETVHVQLAERGGEITFVPTSSAGRRAEGDPNIWSCELLGPQPEFWGTERVDYCTWVEFNQQ